MDSHSLGSILFASPFDFRQLLGDFSSQQQHVCMLISLAEPPGTLRQSVGQPEHQKNSSEEENIELQRFRDEREKKKE